MRPITGLAEIASAYDLILCDVWGVLHNGREAFTGAAEALTRYRAEGGVVVLVTNAPVPAHRVTGVMDRLHFPTDAYDAVATSGEATRRELVKRGGPIYPIGVPGDTSVYDGLDLSLTDDIAAAKAICCTSLRNYPDDEPTRYADEMKRLAETGLEMICANPDVRFRQGDRLIWAAGALAQMYEQVGGAVIRPGKPEAAIYELAYELAHPFKGEVQPERVLAIGDGPETDIRGAMNQSIASLFIGGGIHETELQGVEGFEANVESLLSKHGAKADYALPKLIC